MIINRTEEFLRLRSAPQMSFAAYSVTPIRESLCVLQNEIVLLEQKLAQNTLPSFSSRQRKLQEIDSLKERIEVKLKEVEKTIRNVDISDKRITEEVQSYFLNLLKRRILDFREVQKKSIKMNEEYTMYETEESNYGEEKALQIMMKKNSQIRQNIFDLTNTLLELKLALKQQTDMMDRIDVHFESSNAYMDEANREIIRMPSRMTKYKDYIIYFLLYFLAVLLILSGIKTFRESKTRNHRRK